VRPSPSIVSWPILWPRYNIPSAACKYSCVARIFRTHVLVLLHGDVALLLPRAHVATCCQCL
jgi:hypothetical protein